MNSATMENPFRTSWLNSDQDFQPAWDVPSLNAKPTDWLVEEIRRMRGRAVLDSNRPIAVLFAPAGYGKTHLFGRIAHRLAQEVFFIFVSGFDDPRQRLEHIRWHAVERLFRSRSGEKHPFVAQLLAQFCHSSMLEYFTSFPPSVARSYHHLGQRLQEDSQVALEIVASVRQMEPFLKLAASIIPAFPDERGDVVRALVLAWSPAATTVRRWLRGESLPENDLEDLGLTEKPPTAFEVLGAIAALLRYELPLVLCVDQIDHLLRDKELSHDFGAELIELLQAVPIQIVISSLQLASMRDRLYLPFVQRLKQIKLDTLTDHQAVEVVHRRLADWPAARPERGRTWPFDEGSLVRWARDNCPGPRGLIQHCASAFDSWLERGRDELIILNKESSDMKDCDLLFVHEWNRELEVIRCQQCPNDQQEARLYRAVKEALRLAQDMKHPLAGFCVKNLQEIVLQATDQGNRYGLKVDLIAGKESFAVLVPVTKLDNGNQFRWYYLALKKAVASHAVAGTLLVHAKSDFHMGKNARAEFDEAQRQGKLRVFSLEENGPTYERLECLLRFLDKAEAQELQLGEQSLSVHDCRDLILKTAVLDNLDLFKALAGWRKPAPPSRLVRQPAHVSEALVGTAITTGYTSSAVGPTRASECSAPPGWSEGTVQPTNGQANGHTPPGGTESPETKTADPTPTWAEQRLAELVTKLELWGQPVQPDGVEIGPTFIRLKVRPAGHKTTFKKISDKGIDLKIHLNLEVQPLIASQAGYISVDIQRPDRQTVPLAGVLAGPPAGKEAEPIFPVGRDVAGKTHWSNFADPGTCHLLVAGTTGSGKSEFLKAMVAALAHRLSPEQIQFVFIDPKRVTFNFGHHHTPYLLRPVAYSVEEALPLIDLCYQDTEQRFELLQERQLENIAELQGPDVLPRIVIIVDEFADLMADKQAKKSLEAPLKRIGAKGRAAGVHLVLATQRPEAPGVFPPQLRSNLPGRICLKVASEADSRIVLDTTEGAHLLGRGDLLYKQGGGLNRVQSPLVSKEELNRDLRLA